MAAKTQNHSPFSRISRLIRSGPSSPLARDPHVEVEPPTREDWYVPYNGPYEPPHGMRESVVERDSWGNLVSGWLEGDPQAMAENDRYARTSRDRAKSDAAALTVPPGNTTSSTRNQTFSTTRGAPRTNVNSIIHLDQAGGVGEAPVPMREPLETRPKPETSRHSLASILTLGTRRGLSVRHSASVGLLSGQASGNADQHPPPPTENASGTLFLRRHPYAFPYSSTAATSSPPRTRSPSTSHARQSPLSKIRVPPRPSRTVPPPAYLQPTPRSRIRGSISTPNLRNPQTASQARSPPPPPPLPKGKQRWLSPETWCDALILPRPRFAIRVDPGGGSGRIVSPPGSPVLPNTITYYQSRAVKEPTTGSSNAPDTGMTADSHEPLLTEQRTRSPRSRPPAPPIAGPSRVTVEEQRDAGRSSGDRHDADISKPPTSFKPPRPKSFALDDLALPSPVPSLTKYVAVVLFIQFVHAISGVARAPLLASIVVLEEGRQLEADRKAWQSQATRSFQNKRARSVSRARARTLSTAHRPAREGRASAMDVLAERTLFGNQSRPPTVHVRLQESKSQGFRSSEEAGTGTLTSGGVGVSTFTSHSHGHGHTRSHAHSNSVGTATSSHGRTEESFMWGGSGAGHHQRSHSLSKSALRLVKNTASTAAGFCGFTSVERVDEGGREKVGTPVDEKAGTSDMLESALRRQDTRVLRIQDQVSRDGNHDNVVLITPASPPEHGVAHTTWTGPGSANGLSPVPSAMSSSGEGPVGIAISTPTPSDEVNRQHYGGRERLRFPAHPYAQGATFPMRSSSPEPGRAATRPPDPQHDGLIGDDALERRRQPVLVHPYAPFAQTNHPYASVSPSAGWVKPEPHNPLVQPTVRVVTPAEDDSQEVELPADKANSMYAELTPGHIREFKPEELRYSPFIMVRPVEQQQKGESLSPLAQSHPYSAQSKRLSEWDFAGALTETMRDRGSVDSGLGTSESLEHLRDTERIALHADASGSYHHPVLDDLPPVPLEDPSERLHLSMGRDAARSSSNHTFASSPMEFVNPPSFRVQPTEDRLTSKARSHSSGSSPGVISHDSSPPLSPRSLAATDDLERFRDLFYQPPPRPETPEEPRDESVRRHLPSRQPSSSVSTRSVSGLTTLARQLAEDLDEIRLMSQDSIDDSEASPMWGRRFGGLRGQRPEDVGPHPNIVLSGPSSDVSTPPQASSPPLRFPIDQNASLAAPTINVPEDVEESSRASSIIEYAPREESDTGHMRVGNIEALTTPVVLSSPQRSSTRLSFIHFLRDNEQRASQDVPAARVNSAYSSLGAPLSSEAARSSFMTSGTSRMSGLSDFPVPPTDITPEQLSVLNSYFDDNRNSQQDNDFLSPPRPRVLVREPSTATFGAQTEIGQAL
ncbi:hypothetical protein DAEQUDRAFT_813694 [Daedalea quercina L-15889]|uniref:Uncharacterized protein n=1 Tax=Daedalea quercina L-15889 TaxID=1314783 RepID=A0A165MXI6_9APHY|nr:hypothetical protein DAEQUDRAFT_813694 [Daedalea quercina L-15889]